ncbi:VWA domain-containing protein [Frankia sp. Cr2]|uniref:VWA domain-containing protein n=1 Tax=Frankia sp. Cr2 TaxID=3073932 RepID=UPI002AD46349|nr:VWA domain-containing protein [Frankia sp. Cr2]
MAVKQSGVRGRQAWLPPALVARLMGGAVAVGIVLAGTVVPARGQALPSALPSTAASNAAGNDLATQPVRVVVLVDESGSLSDQDVVNERNAASVIAVADVSPQSQVAVLGFGSSEGRVGQSAVNPVCPLTTVNQLGDQQELLRCIGTLHRRTAEEGNNTDHVAALAQALDILAAPDALNRPKMIFLLTDGRLDVSGSPQYGPDVTTRNAEGQRQLVEKINEARDGKVQIWPIGFGNVDMASLDGYATGGFQGTCNRSVDARPRTNIYTSSSDVGKALLQAFASARCAGVSAFDQGTLAGGESVDLAVDIPPISTDGSIVVLKGSDKVRVTYFDPRGVEVPRQSQNFDGSVLQATTENAAAESLHIRDPRPGTWKVRLTAPAGVPTSTVAASAIWQGRIRSSIAVTPPAPQPGQTVDVRVRLQTRADAVTDPAELRKLTVHAEASGDGMPLQSVPVADDGKGPDRRANDGEFAGQVTVPTNATGDLTFVGRIDGIGVVGDERPFTTRITKGPPPVTADISVDGGRVAPGDTLGGTVIINTADGRPRTLGLRLIDLDPGTLAELSPARIQTNGSGRSQEALTIQFRAGTKLGPASGELDVYDVADPATVVATGFFTVNVAYPSPLLQRLWWLWILLLVAVLTAVARLRGRRRAFLARRDVRDLTMVLHRNDAEIYKLRAPPTPSTRFSFAIRDPRSRSARLDLADGRESAHEARRGDSGELIVRTPGGATITLLRGRPTPIADGLALGFLDARIAGTAGSAGAAGAAGAAGGAGRGSSNERNRFRTGAGGAGRAHAGAGAASDGAGRGQTAGGWRDRAGAGAGFGRPPGASRDQEGGWGGRGDGGYGQSAPGGAQSGSWRSGGSRPGRGSSSDGGTGTGYQQDGFRPGADRPGGRPDDIRETGRRDSGQRDTGQRPGRGESDRAASQARADDRGGSGGYGGSGGQSRYGGYDPGSPDDRGSSDLHDEITQPGRDGGRRPRDRDHFGDDFEQS